MGSTIENIHEGNREYVGLLSPCKIGDMRVKGNALFTYKFS